MRWLAIAAVLAVSAYAQSSGGRPRARELGIAPGALTPGPLNAITDVAGVRVGQATLVEGDTVRTGVTAILPHAGNLFQEKVAGAVFVGNAFGKLAGSTQVNELGTIETPIVLTNTLAVGAAVDAVVRWTLAQPGNENVRSVNALVGETNDGTLNDIRGAHVTREHVAAAIANAKGGAVDEGAVGAGAGTIAFGWKGGIGTSSRSVKIGGDTWTVGVLVQSNYGGKLVIDGVPVWKELRPNQGTREITGTGTDGTGTDGTGTDGTGTDGTGTNGTGTNGTGTNGTDGTSGTLGTSEGSCMIVVATDAPLDPRALQRVAARAVFALARTGSTYSNGSGDFAIAFSTHPSQRVTDAAGPQPRMVLPTDSVSGLFEAVLDATEEAVDNSLLRATDVTANGRTIRALPIEPLKSILKKYGRG